MIERRPAPQWEYHTCFANGADEAMAHNVDVFACMVTQLDVVGHSRRSSIRNRRDLGYTLSMTLLLGVIGRIGPARLSIAGGLLPAQRANRSRPDPPGTSETRRSTAKRDHR